MTLTSEQVDAVTHAWLDLAASAEFCDSNVKYPETHEVVVACRDSVKELEDAFPFLLEK